METSIQTIQPEIKDSKNIESQYIQMLAHKLFIILVDAVPGASEVVSVQTISQFLSFMKQDVNMLIEEIIIATVLLQRFILKQAEKDVHVLGAKNIGMILIISFILAMKICRDRVYLNSYFANVFGLRNADLNRSEAGFLRILDHELWIEDEQFTILHQQLSEMEQDAIIN